EREDGRLVVHVADAAAAVDTVADHGGRRVYVQFRIVPDRLAGLGVEGGEAIVPGADQDIAADGAGTRLGGALRLELPELGALVRVQAVELAIAVLVITLADVEPAVGQAGRREDGFHPAAVVEGPDDCVLFAVEAVELAVVVEAAGDFHRRVD